MMNRKQRIKEIVTVLVAISVGLSAYALAFMEREAAWIIIVPAAFCLLLAISIFLYAKYKNWLE